jgi:GMP synthase (glutamine-hydrolysing)
MILIISTCKEPLHELEFVSPIVNIIGKSDKVNVVHYSKLTNSDINNSDKIIICGTSLQDNDFLNHLDKFSWIKSYKKPLLGICAGMQIIGLIFGGKIQKNMIIGSDFEEFEQDFANQFFEGETLQEVYNLHNNSVTLPDDFIKLNKQLTQVLAFSHVSLPIYGFLFHPEVRNEGMIREFAGQ